MTLLDLIQQDMVLTKRGKDWWGLCPLHAEQTPSFSVVEDREFYYCFGCGASGDGIDYLRKVHGLSFQDACKVVGKDLPESEQERRARERAVKARLVHDYHAWCKAQWLARSLQYRELDTEVGLAEIAYRATVRHPEWFTQEQRDYWQQYLADLYDAAPSLENELDILTIDTPTNEAERFVWWREERSERL